MKVAKTIELYLKGVIIGMVAKADRPNVSDLAQDRDRPPETRTNNSLVLVEAVRRSCGLAGLLCYAAATVTGLQRVSPVIPELIVDQWLLVHRDPLHTQRIRAPIDVIVALFKSRKKR